jgi:hypothetical protein
LKKLAALTLSALLLCTGVSLDQSAQALSLSKKFSNCAELNKTYPGGVAKSSKVKNKGGTTKLKPIVNAKVYAENIGKDRDNDGIACEK